MRKLLLLSFVPVVLLLTQILPKSSPPETPQQTAPEIKGIATSPTIAPTLTPAIVEASEPQKLVIPKLQVSAAVEPVGQDSRGRMDVPKNDFNVSWWMLGSRPGEIGSAVMAGHLDTRQGTAAIFYELGTLEPGDEVQVVDDKGKTLRFEVLRSEIYPDAQFPIEEVFLDSTGKYLNLITCDGVFDTGAANYEDRLVVFTRLIEEG